ncbi:MAG TPA: hypothetical protein VMF08_24085 [Candidatus Sulfotelmatobacter sp.]|nr:hypothetical protein [Candidatus Sulfotelmatobacter sp.]
MKIQTFRGEKGYAVFKISLAVLGTVLLACHANAQAVVDPTLSNGGSTATVNLEGGPGLIGMDNWSVNNGEGMQNQLDQQWFWFSVNGGSVESIDQIGGLTYNVSADDSTLYATYENAELSVGIVYSLDGLGPGQADLSETISITNNMASGAFNINFYQYSNFNLLQNSANNINVVGSPGSYSSIVQYTTGDGNGIEETIDQPFADFAEAGSTNTVLHDVATGATLSGNPVAGPGDVAWAFEWTTNIASGDSLDIYKDKDLSIQPVPEPTDVAWLAMGLGVFGLVRTAWKRNKLT